MKRRIFLVLLTALLAAGVLMPTSSEAHHREGHKGPRPTATPTLTPTPTPTPPPPVTGVQAPVPPSAYGVPAGATTVSTSAGLISALATEPARDIVLASGTYDNPEPFYNINGHRLYAATLGGAVLRAGISMGGNWGPGNGLIRGIAFDVSDPAKTLQGGIVTVWGTGAGSRVLDSTFVGNRIVDAAVLARQTEGLVIQRVRARDFISWGVLADANILNHQVAAPALLEDIDVAGVTRAIPQSSNGTAEACVWVGNTATLRRMLVRNCSWMGLWTGSSNTGSLHEHLDIDHTMVGIYMEHFTTNITVQNLSIGYNVRHGVNCEWADPDWGSKPGCVDNIVQDGTISSSVVGVNLDVGTTRTTARRIVFRNQCWAAIADNQGIGNLWDTSGNDYSGIRAGAQPIRLNENLNTATCQ